MENKNATSQIHRVKSLTLLEVANVQFFYTEKVTLIYGTKFQHLLSASQN